MPMPPSNVPTIIDPRITRPPNGMARPSLRPPLGSRTIDASLPWRADRSRRCEMARRVANDRAPEHSPHIGRRKSGAWHRVLGTSAGVEARLGAAHVPGALYSRVVGLRVWRTRDGAAPRPGHGRGDPDGRCPEPLLPAVPSLSTDAYRYVWDARVSSVGIENLWRLATANQRICACTLGKKMSTADNSNA